MNNLYKFQNSSFLMWEQTTLETWKILRYFNVIFLSLANKNDDQRR